MKKIFLSLGLVFAFINLFATDLPDSIYGIWEGKDRFVFFEETQDNQPQIVILLKEYYGWYYDRAVEPAEYAQKEPRSRNSATTRNAEQVYIDILPISKNQNKGCYELQLEYSRNQKNNIPIVILDDNIFLNFYSQDSEDKNFYRGNLKTDGFKVSQQLIPENLSCLYFSDNKYFDIRYWRSDMDYSDEKVQLNFNSDSYSVDKHIFSGGYNYSCVSGRSKKIRNVVPPSVFDINDYITNDSKTILVTDKEPYLTKLADKKTFEDLMQIVKQGNSRRKPDPQPIFPPNDVNWHWDLIDALEANNAIIQEVRARQKAFGPRPKDIQK